MALKHYFLHFISILFLSSLSSANEKQKVIIVVFENASAMRTLAQPNFQWLTKNGTYFSKFFAVAHPSQPNYIALVAGSTLNVTDDNMYNLNSSHLGDLLEAKGLDWKVFAESYPGNCFLDKKSGSYARRHVPFLSFTNVQSNPSRCQKIVPATNFLKDAINNQLPEFTLYIPDNNNNGHDTGVKFADKYLGQMWIPLLQNSIFTKNHTVFFIFDEDDHLQKNQIFAAAVGAGAPINLTVSTEYNTYSLLRTIEDLFSLGSLNRNDAKANPINEVF